MERWREVWRRGIAPQLSAWALEALRDGLERDDPALVQGATTSPLAEGVPGWPCEGCCAIGYGPWRAGGLETVGEAEAFFATVVRGVEQRMGEEGATRGFLNWYDDTPRELMRSELLAEVERSLARLGAEANEDDTLLDDDTAAA